MAPRFAQFLVSGAEIEMGSIATGRLANLVVLPANPLHHIRNLRSVVTTVKRGRDFQRAGYHPPVKLR